MSDEAIGLILLLALLLGGLLYSAFIGTLCGAFIGWLVSLTPLGTAILKVWVSLTHVECELWELGAFLGFISGFIEGVITVKKSDEE